GYPGDYAPPAPPPGVQVQGYYGSGGAYYGAGGYQSGAYYYGAPMGSTVSVTMPAVTTTTVVTEEVTTSYVRAASRRVV
ncbi:hypothetical protein, partial [Klebsiella aerogenes]|uniref:hypothetical protein n=1 Tax=Klebsiella aerogenes TaxID=548 RepID=UPI0019544077